MLMAGAYAQSSGDREVVSGPGSWEVDFGTGESVQKTVMRSGESISLPLLTGDVTVDMDCRIFAADADYRTCKYTKTDLTKTMTTPIPSYLSLSPEELDEVIDTIAQRTLTTDGYEVLSRSKLPNESI